MMMGAHEVFVPAMTRIGHENASFVGVRDALLERVCRMHHERTRRCRLQ
jgi:hypothetical protein